MPVRSTARDEGEGEVTRRRPARRLWTLTAGGAERFVDVRGVPLVLGLSFVNPPLAAVAALALAGIGLLQVRLYAEYCGNLAAVCDFFRGETPARPSIWN